MAVLDLFWFGFLSMSLDGLDKTDDIDFKTLKTEFPDKRQNLKKNLAYPYELFSSIDDYKKPFNEWN